MSAPSTIWYLEMTDRAQLRPAPSAGPGARIFRHEPASAELNRRLYEAIGHDWAWTDRLGWDTTRWRSHVEAVETWLLALDGAEAGYAELVPAGTDVEIASFGLLPAYRGRGLGGALLTAATRRGFELGSRVWLHTCSEDAPAALPNYERRGFRVFDTRTVQAEAPA